MEDEVLMEDGMLLLDSVWIEVEVLMENEMLMLDSVLMDDEVLIEDGCWCWMAC